MDVMPRQLDPDQTGGFAFGERHYAGPTHPVSSWRDATSQTQGADDPTYHDLGILPDNLTPRKPSGAAPTWYPDNAGVSNVASAAPRRRRGGRRALLVVALGLVGAIVLAAGGYAALAAVRQVAQVAGVVDGPSPTASAFCRELQAQQYNQAYSHLGGAIATTYTTAQFSAAMTDLDAAEGRVTTCDATSGNASASAGSAKDAASLTVSLTRVTSGVLRGDVQMARQAGAWKITGIPTALLGVNMGAALALDSFCTALKGQHYSTVFGQLTSEAQAGAQLDDFTQLAQWQDAVDGQVTTCALTGLGKSAATTSASDTAADLAMSVTRSKLGQKQGTVSLKTVGDVWKVSAVSASLQGTDLGALVTGGRYCAALKKGDSGAVNGLVTASYWTNLYWTLLWNNFAGTKWTGCTLDATTFKLSGSKASFKAAFAASSGGKSTQQQATFQLVQSGGAWKLDNLIFPK
jgi:hypothetical protein